MNWLFETICNFFSRPKAIEPMGPVFLKDMDLSDGYHSFKELYEHRNNLWITVCKALNPKFVWKSKLHSDGTYYEGWFILGYRMKPGKQITYHLPMELWEDCKFAATRNRAPKYDGHSPADALQRIKNLK